MDGFLVTFVDVGAVVVAGAGGQEVVAGSREAAGHRLLVDESLEELDLLKI
jgi:hypothetical protein